mgnify:CR=1 FL=1
MHSESFDSFYVTVHERAQRAQSSRKSLRMKFETSMPRSENR